MATLSTTVLTPVGLTTTGATAGQAAGWQAASVSGDKIPITGRGTILRIRTGATACDVTLNSMVPSSYGTDVNLVISLDADEEYEVYLANDGRWNLGGADKGYAGISYSAVTNVEIAAKVVPG